MSKQLCPGCGKTGDVHAYGFDRCVNSIRAFLAGVTTELLVAEIRRRTPVLSQEEYSKEHAKAVERGLDE